MSRIFLIICGHIQSAFDAVIITASKSPALATIATITFLAAVCPANAHDLYTGTTDPVTHGICCTTSEHEGYGDCDQLVLEPGVLTPAVGGYILRLTVEQARRINPLRTVPVNTFIPDNRVQQSMDGNWHVCIPAYSSPNRGDFFCFFQPSSS